MRVKWTSTINKAGTSYQPETPSVIKRDLLEREVKPLKARYRVSKGVKYDVTPEVIGKPAKIKEEVIREGTPYEGQVPDSFERIEFDADVSELQDYGDVKYYRSEYGKIRVSKNAEYY
ncbi:hypothetical protein HN682_08990 [Candidatus Peregrinibacteria bacterium]|nr:hypothetical protein [Candidatus Peregrinibacteria bacterium]